MGERDELVLRWMIDDFVPRDPRSYQRSMLLGVVSEVRNCGTRAGYEHCFDTIKSAADVAEELVLSAHFAVMLARVVTVSADLLRLNVCCIELQHLGCLVVGPYDRVCDAHDSILCVCWFDKPRFGGGDSVGRMLFWRHQ